MRSSPRARESTCGRPRRVGSHPVDGASRVTSTDGGDPQHDERSSRRVPAPWRLRGEGYALLLRPDAMPHDPSVRSGPFARSEEHTSELQSHSFISYAVFCLKKKK